MSHGPLAAPASPVRGWFVRFAAVYFALFSLERLVGLVPAPSSWAEAVEVGLGHGAAWFGRQLVGITRDLSVEAGAISDTPVGWLRFALSLGIAAIAATVWLMMNRNAVGAQTDRIRPWLRLGLRYVLGPTLLVYGVVKLIPPTQFAYPTLFQLITPFGEASPQGLLWRFMGYSPVYVTALGVAEVAAGLCLLFRRTTLVGALLGAGIMANVLLLNLCYDVPMKLLSGHLLVMAVLLVLPDWHRLRNFFWHHRSTTAGDSPAIGLPLRLRRFAPALKTIVVVWVIGSTVYAQFRQGAADRESYGATPAELRGIWRVESFVRNGETVPPLLTDPSRWGTVIFGDYRVMAVRTTANTPAGAWLVDRATGPGGYTLTRADGSATTPANITFTEDGVMRLQTRLDEADLELRLHRVDERAFRLNSRGFRWISERSFNR